MSSRVPVVVIPAAFIVAGVIGLVGARLGDDVGIAAPTTHAPLILVGGKATPLPATDGIAVASIDLDTDGQHALFTTFTNGLGAIGNLWIGGGGAVYTGPSIFTTSGDTSLGVGALAADTTGAFDTAIGYSALNANTTGVENTAVGGNALLLNTTGNYNTAIGLDSMRANTTGTFNTAVGVVSLVVNTTGTNNTALGADTLHASTTASFNTAVGDHALFTCTTGNENTAVGYSALVANTTGADNTSIGVDSLALNTTGLDNTIAGALAAGANTTGSYNTVAGFDALHANATGDFNTATGYAALHSSVATGNDAVGAFVLYDVTSGAFNTAIGHNTGRGITTGSGNTIVGAQVSGLAAATVNKIILADGSGTAADQIWLSPVGPASVNHGSLGAGSSDTVGNVTGIGAFTSVVLTYSNGGFPNRSWCHADVNTTTTLVEIVRVTNSATAPTFSCFNSVLGVAANCEDFTYWCTGQ